MEILEDLKSILRMRKRLTKQITALINRIKKNLDRAGLRMKKFDLNTIWACQFLYHFVRQDGTLGDFMEEIMKKGHPLEPQRTIIKKNSAKFEPYLSYSLSTAQKILIRQYLVDLDMKTAQKEILKVEIDQMLVDYPLLRKHAYNLASIPGLSTTSAVWILAEIGPINQFKNYRAFASYCGCCPQVVYSADKIYSAHASRHSNHYLREIFYIAAYILSRRVKAESELKSYADRVFHRKSKYSKKLAFYTIATKLARVVYTILSNETAFIPNYEQSKGGIKQSNNSGLFSLTERKDLRKARNSLKRVLNFEGIEKILQKS